MKNRRPATPPALKNALAKSHEATAIFDELPPSHRKEYILWISDAKQPQTVQRRLEKLISMLTEKISEK